MRVKFHYFASELSWLIDCFLGALQCGIVAAAALEGIVDGVERPTDHERDAARIVMDVGAVEHVHVLGLDAGAHAALEHVIEVGTQDEPFAEQACHNTQVQAQPGIATGAAARGPGRGIQHVTPQHQMLREVVL